MKVFRKGDNRKMKQPIRTKDGPTMSRKTWYRFR